ncbi:esterase-like activity of phytase family protein [Poseidonocella sedimentorum]|uniref:Phytase-like domain-containing protein n=1 Tax=Poseidonocella sedimentorum TaxID=871652 RepID=A0A1I6DP02_9RHOB|nr:esterase-like activity of phytase family protein [Poseidonocella sedimentorum]SFR07169.1 hypothetical protein SAMN04515673_104189 [Poseidonocella sedimentorum]
MRFGPSVALGAAALGALCGALWGVSGALAIGASDQAAYPAQPLSSFTWDEEHWAFGGLSGLELDADGRGFIAITDRGHAFRGELEREDDRITGVRAVRHIRLKDDEGTYPQRFHPDTEGLSWHPKGRLYISFEGFTRIWHYDSALDDARWVKQIPGWRDFESNASLEALAIDARGDIYAIPERAPDGAPGFPVYRFRKPDWSVPFRLSESDRYLPVGADFGPDGALYVLERAFTLLQFRSRVRRFTLSGDSIASEEVLLESELGQYDNLEGLSVWRDGEGRTRLTMISDDNFKFFQRSEFVEYVLP